MSHFQDTSVQIHNSLSITLQATCILGSPFWKMIVNSCPWEYCSLYWSAFITDQEVWIPPPIVCCADPPRVCAVGRELWAPFHWTKCIWRGWICSLCHAKAAMVFTVPLVWEARDLHKQLQGNGRFLPGHWNPTDCSEFPLLGMWNTVLRGDPRKTQLCSSVGSLSWESWKGKKANANSLGIW